MRRRHGGRAARRSIPTGALAAEHSVAEGIQEADEGRLRYDSKGRWVRTSRNPAAQNRDRILSSVPAVPIHRVAEQLLWEPRLGQGILLKITITFVITRTSTPAFNEHISCYGHVLEYQDCNRMNLFCCNCGGRQGRPSLLNKNAFTIAITSTCTPMNKHAPCVGDIYRTNSSEDPQTSARWAQNPLWFEEHFPLTNTEGDGCFKCGHQCLRTTSDSADVREQPRMLLHGDVSC